MMYALKHQDKYLRFASYRSVTLVDTPEKATLYSRFSDAEKRKNSDTCFIKREPIAMIECKVVEINFTFTEREVTQ